MAKLPDEITVDGEARISLEADLHPDGSFGCEWMVVTADRLLVYEKNGKGFKKRHDFLLSELSEPKASAFIGGGAVEITREGLKIELIRYTTSKLPAFAGAVGYLGKCLKGEEADVPEQEELRCPNCGLPLDKGTKVCRFCTPKRKSLARLVRYLKPLWKAATALSLLAILGTAMQISTIYLQKPLIDNALNAASRNAIPQRLRLLLILVFCFLMVNVIRTVMGVVQSWLAAWLGNKITHDIRCELYRHLQYLSLRFFDKRQMGTVISRVNQDTSQLQQFLVWGSQDLACNILLLAGTGIFMFFMNWKLALFVLVPAPVICVLSGKFWRRIRMYMRRFFHHWGKVNSVLNESMNGLRIVKAFAQERREIERFESHSYRLATSGVTVERMWATLFSGIGLLMMMGTMLVWYFGGRDVILSPQKMSLGSMMAFINMVGAFYGPVQSLSMLLNWSSRSLTAAERVFEVLDTQPETSQENDSTPMPHITGHLEFRDVTFGYERHQPVLKKISIDIAPGEMIGLVGHSGAGKSTTINLLCRFYEVSEGEILIDGVPINKIRLEDLRSQIGLVPQDTFLFSGTISDNISYAKPGATREEIVKAAKIANAHDFIRRKPDGYETWIGEGGQGISAGERQRLAIARAVLHDPRILILDEATSQMDVETEKQIQEAIDRLVKGRTTVAIAHRLSTLKNADRLVVLKQGEVAEMGTHDELLAKEGGEFKKLVETYQEISRVHVVQR